MIKKCLLIAFFLFLNIAIADDDNGFLDNATGFLAILDTAQRNFYNEDTYNVNNLANFPKYYNDFYVVGELNVSKVTGRVLVGYQSNYYSNEQSHDINSKILLLYYQDYFGQTQLSLGKQLVFWSVSSSVHPLDLFSRDVFSGYDLGNFSLREEGMLLGSATFSLNDNNTIDFVVADDRLDYNWEDETNNYAKQTNAGTYIAATRLTNTTDGLTSSIVLAKAQNDGWKIGGSASYSVGQSLELHGEFITTQNNSRGVWDTNTFSYVINDDEVGTQAVVGLSYSFEKIEGLTIIAEYLYNGYGLSVSEYNNIKRDTENLIQYYPDNTKNQIWASFGRVYTNQFPLQQYGYIRVSYSQNSYEFISDFYKSIEDSGYFTNTYITYSFPNAIDLRFGGTLSGGGINTLNGETPLDKTLYLTARYILR